MGRHASARLGGLAILAALTLTTRASADSPAEPKSYKRVAPGGRFVFVMLSPSPQDDFAADREEIRRAYPRSGMYRAAGPAEPLWTVDWYARDVRPTADGVHLVRPGPWPWLSTEQRRQPELGGTALEQEGVSFFAAGRLLRTYRIGELVDRPNRLPRSVSHFEWVADAGLVGDWEYALTTRDGNRFAFDVRTGDVISASRVGPEVRWGWWAAVVAATAGAGAGVWWLVRRRPPRRAVAEPLSWPTDLNENVNPSAG